MKRGIGQLTFAAVLLVAVCPPASAEPRRSLNRGKFPVSFEPNVGQAAADVAFVTRGQRHTSSLLPTGVRLSLDGAPLMIEFVGGNRAASLRPRDTLPGTV